MDKLSELLCVHCKIDRTKHVESPRGLACLFGPTLFRPMTQAEYVEYSLQPLVGTSVSAIRDALASQGFARSILPAVPLTKKEDEP